MTATGLEPGDQVRVACPACTPGADALHEVLKPDGQATVRCRSCGHVHKVQVPSTTREDVRVIVSREDESIRTTAAVPTDEVLAVGEEFVADTADGPMGVRITSLEREDGERTESAPGGEVRTIWTRAVDNVAVRVTVHPADGRREGTVSETYYLPGDEELVVGEPIPLTDDGVQVEQILLRDDVAGQGPDSLDRSGDAVPAKDAKRVFARKQAGDTWRSPWD